MELDPTLADALHGLASKKRILSETGIPRKSWLIFERHYGFADGTDWSYAKLARHYRVSEQCIAKKLRSVRDRLRAWAQAHTHERHEVPPSVEELGNW